MALFARTTVSSVEFVSRLDPDVTVSEVPVDKNDPKKGTKEVKVAKKGASRFKIAPLDVFLMAHIQDNASTLSKKGDSEDVGISTHIRASNIEMVRYGLRELPSDFKDTDDHPITYVVEERTVNNRTYVTVQDSVLEALGIGLVDEMAEAIRELSEVSPTAEKN